MTTKHILIPLLFGCVLASQGRAGTPPGCDQERWDNWAEIMEEARGWPEEQAEIRKAADYNRIVCDDLAAGVLTVEEADRLQSESTDALWRSMQRKKARRQESAGAKEAG